MKSLVICFVLLFGLLCITDAQKSAETTTTTLSPDITSANADGLKHSILQLVQQINTDYTQMVAAGNIDNQILLQDVTALDVVVRVGLEGCTPALRNKILGMCNKIRNQVSTMTIAGKFDPSVLQAFLNAAAALPSQTASTVTSGK